jgi:hypothetical protein
MGEEESIVAPRQKGEEFLLLPHPHHDCLLICLFFNSTFPPQMSSNKSKSSEFLTSKGTDRGKKSKTQSSLAQTFGNNAFLLSSLRKTHTGKRILLHAKDIYNGTVPDEEEAYLFQYFVSHVNADCKTATIDFDEKCIVEKGDMFQNYPNFGDEDTSIQDYKIEMLNDDHELFNAHLGQVNKRENDLKERQRKREQDEKVGSTDDIQDVDDRFHFKKIDGYSILVAEFVPEGALTEHLIQAGLNAGKKSTKQDWSKLLCCVRTCYYDTLTD